MATVKPVLCLNCGAQVKKNGYCSACSMPQSVLKKAYNTSDYYYNIGYDKAAARDLSGAIESLNMSLRYNKKNIMTRNLLGLIYYEMGETILALSHWVMSDNYQASDNIAAGYLKELKQDSSKLEEADFIAKKFNTALGYAANYDYDLALIQLKSVLGTNPHFVKGYLLLALIHIQDSNYEKARAVIRKVLSIDRANPLAIHYLREMGDSDDNIIKFRMESQRADGMTTDSDYLDRIAADVVDDEDILNNPRKKKIIISRKEQANVKSLDKEVRFVKYSGMYMLLGLILGILLMSFVVFPGKKRKLVRDNEAELDLYSEQLAVKNSSIKALNDQIERLNQELEDLYAEKKAAEDAKLPDYSNIQHGMSDEDIWNMLLDE